MADQEGAVISPDRKRDVAKAASFKRRFPMCSRCGHIKHEDLHVHHIEPFSLGGADDDENFIVLCSKCHKEWHRDVEGNADFYDWVDTIPSWVAARVPMDHLSVADARELFSRVKLYRLLRAQGLKVSLTEKGNLVTGDPSDDVPDIGRIYEAGLL